MLRSIGKQSGVFVESFPKKKRKATVGRKAINSYLGCDDSSDSSRESSLDIRSRRRTHCTVTTAPMGRRYTTLTAAASTV